MFTSQFYKLQLSSITNKASNLFPDWDPVNLLTDKDALAKVEDYFKILTKFNIYFDAVVVKR